jgi:ABC-2 type transport system permease protein
MAADIIKTIRFIWECFKLNIASAMEYRASFIIQSSFMFLNDIFWVIFWVILFGKFPVMNSWGLTEIMWMMSIITISWGLVGVFFGNFTRLADIISEGYLDFYLSLPKDELLHSLASKAKFQAVGDIVFGLVLAIFFIPLVKVPLFILLLAISMIIIIAFSVIFGSLAFYLGNSREASRQGLMGVLSLASYPFSVFQGYTKFIMLTLFPAGFITGIPVQILQDFSVQWMIILIVFTIVIASLAWIIFKAGIKRYESGSSITLRV